MNRAFKLVIKSLFVLHFVTIITIQDAQANCLRDYTSHPYPNKPALKAGLAYIASVIAIPLLGWSAFKGFEYASLIQSQQDALPPCNENTCPYGLLTFSTSCTYYGNTQTVGTNYCMDNVYSQCKDIISQCVAYANLRAQGISQSLFSVVGGLGTAAMDIYFSKRSYQAVCDYFKNRSRWKKNRNGIKGMCTSLIDSETIPTSLIDLYEEVLLKNEELTINDVYYHLSIYGNELNEFCPNGQFFDATQIRRWLKSRNPIVLRDFLKVAKTADQYPEEFIEAKALFDLMKPSAMKLRDSILARNMARNALAIAAEQIIAFEPEVERSNNEMKDARAKRDSAKISQDESTKDQELISGKQKIFKLNELVFQNKNNEWGELNSKLQALETTRVSMEEKMLIAEDNRIDAYNAFILDLRGLIGSHNLEIKKDEFRLKLRRRDLRRAGVGDSILGSHSENNEDHQEDRSKVEEGSHPLEPIPSIIIDGSPPPPPYEA